MPVRTRPGPHFRLIFAGASRIGSVNFCLKYSCNMVIIINVHFAGLFIVVYGDNDWTLLGSLSRLYVLIPEIKYWHFIIIFISAFLWIFFFFLKNTNSQNKNKIEIIFKGKYKKKNDKKNTIKKENK